MVPYNFNLIDFRSFTLVDPNKPIKTRVAGEKVKRIVFHCTDANGWTADRLSRFFVEERGFPICGYHYYIREDGVYHMVGDNIISYHAAGYNSTSIGFSIDYNPTLADRLNQDVHPIIFDTAQWLAAWLCLKFKIAPIKGNLVGHRELFGTGWIKDKQDKPSLRKTCPGLRINLNAFRYNVARRVQEYIKINENPDLVVDGVWGPKSQTALEIGKWA